MRYLPTLLAAIVTGVLVGAAHGQTLQLPTFNMNSVTTTVTAPDGGTVTLGGVPRASSGRIERGVPMLGKLPYAGRLFNNRAIGQDYTHSSMNVTPRIIILEEEEAKLGIPDYSSGAPIGGVLGSSLSRNYGQAARELSDDDVQALRLSQYVATNQDEPAVRLERPAAPSAAEIRQRNEQAAQTRHDEAYKYFEKGIAAEEAGKTGVAKIYYNMAARRAPSELRAAIDEKLAGLQDQ